MSQGVRKVEFNQFSSAALAVMAQPPVYVVRMAKAGVS